jgi:holin-like protein
MFEGMLILGALFLVGEWLSSLTGGYIPGSILGMLGLFIVMQLGWIDLHRVSRAAELLIKNIPLLLLPTAIGVMDHFDMLQSHWLFLLILLVIPTALTIVLSGWLLQRWLSNR